MLQTNGIVFEAALNCYSSKPIFLVSIVVFFYLDCESVLIGFSDFLDSVGIPVGTKQI